MKLLKNLEAVFLITATFAVSSSYVMADPADAAAAPQAAAAVPGMQVVVVSAKRMTAAEKQQSLRADETLALRAAQARRS